MNKMVLCVAMVFAALPTGVVAAAGDGPSCDIVAPKKAYAGEPVSILVESGLAQKASVYFGDATDPKFVGDDGYVNHTFAYEGSSTIVASIPFGRGWISCSHDIQVMPGKSGTGTNSAPSGQPEPDSRKGGSNEETSSASVDSITGDSNIVPVINGDQNKVIITIDQAPVQVAKPEPKLNIWQKILLPFNAFMTGVIDFLTTIRNGWFGPDLVH